MSANPFQTVEDFFNPYVALGNTFVRPDGTTGTSSRSGFGGSASLHHTGGLNMSQGAFDYSDDYLAHFGLQDIYGNGITPDESQAAAEYQNKLNWLQELNTRKYNEGLRDYDNQYNSPAAQVARLMATGMSRDAALAAVAGMSQSAGVSAPGANPGAATYDPYAGQRATNEQMQALMNVGTGLFSMIGNGIRLGYDIPNMQNQNALGNLGLQVSQRQMSGYQATDTFWQHAIRAYNNGNLKMSGDVNNFQDVPTLFQSMMNVSAEQDPELYAYMHGNGYAGLLGNSYALDNVYQGFNNMVSTFGLKKTPDLVALERDAFIYDSASKHVMYDNLQTEWAINKEKLTTELLQQGLIGSQTNLVDSQAGYYESMDELTRHQITGQQRQNAILGLTREQMEAVTPVQIREAQIEFGFLTKLTTKEAIEDRLKSYCADRDKFLAMASVLTIESNQSAEWLKNHPDATGFAMWMDKYSVKDIVTGIGKGLGFGASLMLAK